MRTSSTKNNGKGASVYVDSLSNRIKINIPRPEYTRAMNVEEIRAENICSSVMKRLTDVMGAAIFLVFCGSWLFLLIAVLIKLDTKGAVFFVQRRRGKQGKIFRCIKFRTMICSSKDVDANGHYMQAQYNDPRITGFGMLLRKYSFDELPQFINVLLGSMSLVGPRPHPEPLNINTENRLPHYNKRHLVKPGITGLAQIKGYRGHTMHNFELMEKRVMYDLLYIRKWSILLDIRILLSTLIKYPLGV